MINSLKTLLKTLENSLQSYNQLILENLLLRHQLTILQRNAKKPRLERSDRVLFVFLSKVLKNWRQSITIVKPDTVIKWHRKGFKQFWPWKSRNGKPGRNRIDPEIRKLIRNMSLANHLWGAPRIHGELLKLGIDVSQATVRRYMVKHQKPPSQTWKTFLENHVKELVAIDFFVVPTINFRVLYVFIIIAHFRRKIIHFNVTDSPTVAWTGQQIVEALPWDSAPKYLIRDNDKIYGFDFTERVKSICIIPVRTAYKSPWQNSYCERVIGTIRRGLYGPRDHIQRETFERVLSQYVNEYYNVSRTHLSLDKDCPEPRDIETPESGKVIEISILGGLHHRYGRQAA